MPKVLDLTGKTFGHLRAIRPVGKTRHGAIVWEFVCKCGETVERRGDVVVRHAKAGMGCACVECIRERASDRLSLIRDDGEKRASWAKKAGVPIENQPLIERNHYDEPARFQASAIASDLWPNGAMIYFGRNS